jgi:capsular polysaccharide transport system permease protein
VDTIDEAIAALHVGDYGTADRILASLGGGKPGTATRLRALWALTQVMRRKFGDGVEAIIEIGQRAPGRAEPVYQQLLRAVGPFEAVFPADAAHEIRLRVGDYFLRDESTEEAMAWLAAALAEAPDDPLAIYLEANCRFALYGERRAVHEMEAVLDRASEERERAYIVAGGTAALWYRLGVAHDRMKNLETAAQYLEQAVALDPRNDSQRLLLGDVLIRLARFDEAITQLEPIEKYADNYRFAGRLRAVALFRIGETDEALALLQEVADLDPLGALTFLEMGRVYLARGEFERAELALARAFRTDPELPGLRSAIVQLERHLGRHVDPDAGLPHPGEFDIPELFEPRPHDPALREEPSLWMGLAAHFRTLHTIILRDVLIRYSHAGIGYLWAIAQPLAYVGTLALLYKMIGHTVPFGTSSIAYIAAGIVPYICFYVRVESAVSSAVASNVNLLYFRQVTPLVLILANLVREFVTSLVVFIIITLGLALYDNSYAIDDPLTILFALFGISLLGMVIGALFGLGRLAFPAVQLAEVVIHRTMFFFSGALFYANLVPARERAWALYNPLLHLIEFVRDGVFKSYHSRYAEWSYPWTVIALGIALMVFVISATRRYVAAQ